MSKSTAQANTSTLAPARPQGGAQANALGNATAQGAGNAARAAQLGLAPAQTSEVSRQVSDGPYGWTASYSVTLTDTACSVAIKAKVTPDADVPAREAERVKRVTAAEFARYFDRRFTLESNGKSLPLRVALQFVDSGEHLAIALHSGVGRDDLSNWFVDSIPVDRAHELGHQLGLKDEYEDATVPDRATDTSPGVSHDHSIMGDYYSQGTRAADVRQRHGDQLASDISAATGQNFTAKMAETYVVRQGDVLSTIALRLYGDESKWPAIHALNRKKVPDPNLLLVGTELRLPPRTP